MRVIGTYLSCPACNKNFICYAGTWRYKRYTKGKVTHYCSYKCYMATEPAKKKSE